MATPLNLPRSIVDDPETLPAALTANFRYIEWWAKQHNADLDDHDHGLDDHTDVAIDSARMAFRQGAMVMVVYRRTR